jgi:hypothetical protein
MGKRIHAAPFPATIEEYRAEVDREAERRFAIEWNDMGGDDELLSNFEDKTPIKELLDYKRDKYDLDERGQNWVP